MVARLLFGLSILTLGVIFTLDNLHVIEAGDYFRYWPVLLIAFGLGKLIDPGHGGRRLFGLTVAGFGVLLLLENLGAITWRVWDLWPVVLILVGLSIVWQAMTGRGRRGWRRRHRLDPHGGGFATRGGGVHFRAASEGGIPSAGASSAGASAGSPGSPGGPGAEDPESTIDSFSFLGGDERRFGSREFRGGRVSAVFGGAEIDLRESTIAGEEASLEVFAAFGGIEIKVPREWRVIVRVSAVLGGIEDKTLKPADEGAKRCWITGQVILGGVEISNG
ncbi:MAG: LiaI-LiaF-like domain-containing protein [Candidatus Eisenbacteria bacterium]